jgi:hypothetical protein
MTGDVTLGLRPAGECRWDAVSLGEVMLRLDPGERRIRTARRFSAWEGGGEYNVTRGLRRCFGQRTAVVTALVENEVGRLVEDLILTGGVDTSLIKWVPDDGIGRTARNGLNFTERGFGVRGAVGCSDRGNTAAAQLRAGDVDWDDLCGGSTPAASSPPCQNPAPTSPWKRSRRPSGTAPSPPMTSTSARACGRASAAPAVRAKSTPSSPATWT